MARRTAAAAARSGARALRAVLPPDVIVIAVPADAVVTVEVDVNEMVIPYTVAIDTTVLIKSLVDRREDTQPLAAGPHRLSWGFAHAVKNWKHTIAILVDGQRTVLEDRSEANKDTDHSLGVAFLMVG